MGRNSGIIALILASTFIFAFSSGCSNTIFSDISTINVINQPDELPDELQNFIFFLFKTGDFGSKVIVQNLDMVTKYSYQNEHEISSVDVSQDGKYLVYNQLNKVDGILMDWLWLVNLEENHEKKIAGWRKDISELIIDTPSISSDGKYVLFSISWLDSGRDGLARVDLDGNSIEILDTTKRLLIGPVSSPDGSSIMVMCAGYKKEFNHTGLCLLDSNGRFIKYLVDNECFYSKSYFSPDGEHIFYSEYYSAISMRSKYRNKFYMMDLSKGQKTLLLTWDIAVLGFSSQGKEIVFIARKKPNRPNQLYIMNIDGTNLRHLAYYDEFLEEWYADAD